MNHVGFSELALLFVIGLVILGPERLPRVASQLGRWVGRARRTAHQLRQQLEREVALHDIGDQTKWKPPPQPSASTPPDESSATAPDESSATAPDVPSDAGSDATQGSIAESSTQGAVAEASTTQSSAAETGAAENTAAQSPEADSNSREEPPSR